MLFDEQDSVILRAELDAFSGRSLPSLSAYI